MTEALTKEQAAEFNDLIGLNDLESLALIGLSKNAGKTTCLNHIITAWQVSGQTRPLALTSIGRDGEKEDILSGRAKPRIYIPTGTFIAVAEGALQRSDALLEILELTNIRTAFGEVVICRALSNGYVELAGPSTTDELAVISDKLRNIEPECLFIIDGALSRRSQARSGLSEAVILAVSAASSAVPEVLAEKTAFALDLLQTSQITGSKRTELLKSISEKPTARGIIFNHEEERTEVVSIFLPSLVGFGQEISRELHKNSYLLFLHGAITDQLITELLKESNFSDLRLVVQDGTRLFIKPETLRKLHNRKIKLAVLDALDVRLVCLNPTRSNGHLSDPEPLLRALRQKITNIPVVDLGPSNW